MDDQINEVMPQIRKAAKNVVAKWPGVVEEEDMIGDLVLHFLERPGSLEALADLPVDKRTARLTAIGHEKASAERSAKEVFSGQFSYSVDEVKRLLANGGLDGHVDGFDASVEDLSRASAELRNSNDRYHELIWQRYVIGKIPTGPDKNALTRALVSLTDNMNKLRRSDDYEYANGSRFRNNRQAVNATDLDYVGSGRYDE